MAIAVDKNVHRAAFGLIPFLVAIFSLATAASAQDLSVAPTAELEAVMSVYDSSTQKQVNWGTSRARLGVRGNYKTWLSVLEIEANGPGGTESGQVDVRQGFVGKTFGAVQTSLGRHLTGSALTYGRFFSHHAVQDTYGSTDGLRVSSELKEAGNLKLSVTVANSLGGNPVADMQAASLGLSDPYEVNAGRANKEGLAWIASAAANFSNLYLSAWYGAEKNRISSAPVTAAQPHPDDKVFYKNYQDLQASVAYVVDAWSAHTSFRQTKRSRSAQGRILANGTVSESGTNSVNDNQRQTLIALGGEYTYMQKDSERWILGLDLMDVRTATDDLTKAEEKVEDDSDTRIFALTQSVVDGPFEISARLYYAKAAGPAFANHKAVASATDKKIMATLAFGVAFN